MTDTLNTVARAGPAGGGALRVLARHRHLGETFLEDPPPHPSHRTRPEDREALRVMTHDAAKWLAALALARKEADY